jgi:hypothetical protein
LRSPGPPDPYLQKIVMVSSRVPAVH